MNYTKALTASCFGMRGLVGRNLPAEQKLGSAIRNRSLSGFKFRRQHPINNFIADVYCHECKIIVELDGLYHSERDQAEYDEGRTFQLTELGITVIRFTNDQVLTNVKSVLKQLLALLTSKKEPADTLPSPRRRPGDEVTTKSSASFIIQTLI